MVYVLDGFRLNIDTDPVIGVIKYNEYLCLSKESGAVYWFGVVNHYKPTNISEVPITNIATKMIETQLTNTPPGSSTGVNTPPGSTTGVNSKPICSLLQFIQSIPSQNLL